MLINENKNFTKINEVVSLLNQKKIEIRPLWKPMNLQPVFKKYKYYGSGLEEKIYNKGFCLPSGSNLSIGDKRKIYTNLISILNI